MQERKTKVLVIDDEKGFTDLFKLNLERKYGYEVYCENDSENALATARKFMPDIIILDVVMPGKDGADVSKEIGQEPRLKQVPVVFLTALLDNRESGGKVFTAASGDDWIAKPCRLSTICNFIDRRVEKQMENGLRTDDGKGARGKLPRASLRESSRTRKIECRAACH